MQGIFGHTKDPKYKDIASNKLLLNSHITTHEITNADSMFGPNLVGARGKKVGNKPSSVDIEENVKIPEYFYRLHKFVMLTADVIFFQWKRVHDNIRKEAKVHNN